MRALALDSLDALDSTASAIGSTDWEHWLNLLIGILCTVTIFTFGGFCWQVASLNLSKHRDMRDECRLVANYHFGLILFSHVK
jgi:hypothetical protein